MKFDLPALPYAMNALEPYISARTLEFHYGKHHRSYVDRLNASISGADRHKNLEQLICTSVDHEIFNLAAQAWNHDFFWRSLSPEGGGEPPATLVEILDEDFGSVHGFKQQLATAADALFGSGWVWLIRNREGRLEIDATGNAGNPMTEGNTPLLTLDVWEHAYYLDYQNRRGRYIDIILERLINWHFIEQNLQSLFRAESIDD